MARRVKLSAEVNNRLVSLLNAKKRADELQYLLRKIMENLSIGIGANRLGDNKIKLMESYEELGSITGGTQQLRDEISEAMGVIRISIVSGKRAMRNAIALADSALKQETVTYAALQSRAVVVKAGIKDLAAAREKIAPFAPSPGPLEPVVPEV